MFSQHNNSFSIANQEDSMFQNNDKIDPYERAKQHLKDVFEENDRIENEINLIREKPSIFINPLKNQFKIKIKELKEENQKLKRLVEQSKMPVYSEMKRKSFFPNENIQKSERDSYKSSIRQSMRNSINGRSALSQINSNSNYDKNENASTCFNEDQRIKRSQQVNPILKLQKPSPEQQSERSRITSQIHYLIAKTQIFQNTISDIKQKEDKQCRMQIDKILKDEPELTKIQQYKKKLCRLLNKLKSREVQMDQMVKMYKALHEQTIKKLQQSTLALKQLQQEKIDDDVEKKYSEVLELEERLQILNAEIEQMDEQKWLEKVFKELSLVFRRLGIPIPKSESAKQGINELCQILMEHHLMCKQDHTEQLVKLKQYYEDQKQTNQKLIQNLKAKQQTLSKKINNIQMQKGSESKNGSFRK